MTKVEMRDALVEGKRRLRDPESGSLLGSDYNVFSALVTAAYLYHALAPDGRARVAMALRALVPASVLGEAFFDNSDGGSAAAEEQIATAAATTVTATATAKQGRIRVLRGGGGADADDAPRVWAPHWEEPPE